MTEPTGPDPALPASGALRRRVLLAGVVTLALYLGAAVVASAVGAPSWTVLPALLVIIVLVTRPLLKPVLEANRLRKDLAYQAFLEDRGRG